LLVWKLGRKGGDVKRVLTPKKGKGEGSNWGKRELKGNYPTQERKW